MGAASRDRPLVWSALPSAAAAPQRSQSPSGRVAYVAMHARASASLTTPWNDCLHWSHVFQRAQPSSRDKSSMAARAWRTRHFT